MSKSCVQVAENLDVNRFASLGLNAEPCFRNENHGLTHWELGSSVTLLPHADFSVSFGYQYERLPRDKTSWKQEVWQQVELKRRLPIGSGFGSLRLEQRRLQGANERQRLKLKGGVFHDLADELRLQVATELVMKEDADGHDSLSELTEHTTTVSFLTSLSPALSLKLDYEYKYAFGKMARQIHQFELNLIWSDDGIRVQREVL